MVVKTPSNLQNSRLVEYTWPEPAVPTTPDMNAYYVKIDPNTFTENIFPDPSSTAFPWGTVTVGANAACTGGIAITPDNIGTENNPHSFIDPNNPNVLFAEPLNKDAGATVGASINAQDITARFRLANWVPKFLPNPPTTLSTIWTDILAGNTMP